MAAIAITSWNLYPLNADDTVDTDLPDVVGGTVPTGEFIDYAAMGQKFRLELNCTLSGSYPDSTAADIRGSIIRYNPGLFVEPGSVFYPPLSFPQGGYSVQVPMVYDPTYPMPLIGQHGNLNANENGTVTIALNTLKTFTITHEFRVTADMEDYIVGNAILNQFRLSKNSVFALQEGTISRPSVFGYVKALNASVAMKQRGNNLFAEELSLRFSASFNANKSDGTPDKEATFEIERVSLPGEDQTNLSPWEDNKIIITFQDPGYTINVDKVTAIVTSRELDHNVSNYEVDLEINEVLLVTTGSSAQIQGNIYGPVTYTQANNETTVTFVLKGTDLTPNTNYQIHALAQYQDSPTTVTMEHVMSGLMGSDGGPFELDFEMLSELWTRNGNHAQDFTATSNERVTSVLSINKTEYDANAMIPYANLDDDLATVLVQILEADGTVIFQDSVTRNSLGVFPETAYIGNIETSGPSEDTYQRFYLKEFRPPYFNLQGLDDWIGTTHTFRWKLQFKNLLHQLAVDYIVDSWLTIRNYDNAELSPSQDDIVTNIRFLDPTTGLPIANWCDLSTILVKADITDIGATTYIAAMIDKFPLGVSLFNDFALQEEDPITHSLPSYVIFEDKSSSLLYLVPDQATDGTVTFYVDISGLTDDEKYRIFVQAYRAT